MKSIPTAILAFFCLATTAAAEVDGVWKTAPGNDGSFVLVRIGPCPEAPAERCGTVVGAPHARTGDVIGSRILSGLTRRDPLRWTGGRIQRPGSARVYRSNLTVDGDVLEVEGCVAGGILCGSQDWTRVQ
ncbi:MAG: DUF2147 domain-containing protein [Pseudomonadota bacterium]